MTAFAIAAGLVLLVLVSHHWALWALSFIAPGDGAPRHGRALVAIVLLNAVHLLEIVFFAGALVSLSGRGRLGVIAIGTIDGPRSPHFLDFLHLSAVSYTTLGLSDFTATGGLRLVVALEALTGFGALTWSATYLYSAFRSSWSHRG